jgi:hypothetical protein
MADLAPHCAVAGQRRVEAVLTGAWGRGALFLLQTTLALSQRDDLRGHGRGLDLQALFGRHFCLKEGKESFQLWSL